MMNRSIFIGRITEDLTLTTSESGTKLTKFSLAVQRRGNADIADFIPCVAFGKTAEMMNEWLKKGSRIAIEGHFQSSKYVNQENKTIYKLECIVDTFQFLDTKIENA